MSAIKLSTPSSGSISLSPADTASNLTITVPAVTGTMATLTTPAFVSTIGVGGATPAASGAGITFPSTQSASSDANTLDDYEEGTWTPTVARTGSSYTFGDRVGTYTKIGRQVTCQAYINVTAITTQGSSFVTLTGFPFTCMAANGRAFAGAVFYNNICTTTPIMSIGVFNNGTFAYLHGTNRDDNPLSENVTTGYLMATVTYFID